MLQAVLAMHYAILAPLARPTVRLGQFDFELLYFAEKSARIDAKR